MFRDPHQSEKIQKMDPKIDTTRSIKKKKDRKSALSSSPTIVTEHFVTEALYLKKKKLPCQPLVGQPDGQRKPSVRIPPLLPYSNPPSEPLEIPKGRVRLPLHQQPTPAERTPAHHYLVPPM